MALTPLIGEGQLRVTHEASPAPPETHSWLDGAVVFDNRHWACGEAELTWTAPSHLIVLTQSGRTAKTRVSCAGELIHDGFDRPGALSFVPAGVERSGLYQDADLVYSALWLAPGLACLGERSGQTPPILINRSDNVISALLSSLQAELASGGGVDAAYVEHLAAIVLHRIAMLDGVKPPGRDSHGPISNTMLRRIQEHIDAHLGQEISLSDLARVAGMGCDSFARRFRAKTGLAPYAYVIERRIRRAEQLLADTDIELARLAARLGFSSQSHFTTTFKRQRGVTPRAYRQRLFS
jgi:AraC family transcriptional regulator